MKFCELLNELLDQLDCRAKEVCEVSGLSAATLSRYRSGERLPDPNAENFERLCLALADLAAQRGRNDLTTEALRTRLLEAEDLTPADTGLLMQNFDTLVSTLNLNLNRLCRHINYDTSTVFRFRSGARRPAEPDRFAAAVAGYVAREFDAPGELSVLAQLLDCPEQELADPALRLERLTRWLLNGRAAGNSPITDFLVKLDDFDLNDYIRAIHFDELKVPTAPFQMPTSRTCCGLKEMMEGELDFLKATVLSKSMEPVIMYSDMPMNEMARDPDFPKKWMYGMALLLKKGLHLHQIHQLDRSFEEMMLGLESWIPMYMTGQISPYYLKSGQNSVFLHFLKVSGAAALSGEAIAGHHADGRYYLTNSKKELAYYTKRAQELLSCAYPLMNIYRSDSKNQLEAFLLADSREPGPRRGILSTLPLHTMEEPLLTAMLSRHGLDRASAQALRDAAAACRQRVERILEHNPLEEELPLLTREEFAARPLMLDLSVPFFERDLPYTYEEYQAHLEATRRFADDHENYTLKLTSAQTFRNLQIYLHEGKWAMLSKGRAPTIHFVIRHPRLRSAIESFLPPMVETGQP